MKSLKEKLESARNEITSFDLEKIKEEKLIEAEKERKIREKRKKDDDDLLLFIFLML